MHFISLILSTALAMKPAPVPHVFYYQTITFKKGSADLSTEDLESFRELLKSIRDKKQKVEQVHAAVWPDKTSDKTSAQTRDVVELRIAVLEDTLEERFGIGNVESYNMARRSNWFSRGLTLNDKDLKALFALKGAPGNVTPDDFQVIRTKGGPGHAVLLIELEAPQT